MITLLASLGGFFAPFASALLKLWQDKSDKSHELAILQLQMQAAKDNADVQAEEVGATAYASQMTALYNTYKTGISWVDALNGTVRPVLAFAFFFLYAAVKYIQYSLIGDHAPSFEYLDIMWTDDDKAIFAAVIAFYFGQREVNKGRSK
jgi:hypothetical protein